jgi:hypothetical protein
MRSKLKNQNSGKRFNSAGAYNALSGCMEPIGSDRWRFWVSSLPDFLKTVYLSALEEEGRVPKAESIQLKKKDEEIYACR